MSNNENTKSLPKVIGLSNRFSLLKMLLKTPNEMRSVDEESAMAGFTPGHSRSPRAKPHQADSTIANSNSKATRLTSVPV